MKIVLDARWIFPEISGIGLYTQELIRGLVGLDQPHRFVLLFDNHIVLNRTAEVTGFDKNPLFAARIVNFGPFAPRGQLAMPWLLKHLEADLYHSTNWMMPLFGCGKIRKVVTIHDLIPLLFRDHAPKSKKARLFPIYKELMRQVARRADLIIAVSESTRADILRELKVSPQRHRSVVSIPEAADAAFRPGAATRPSPNKGGTSAAVPKRPRILYVGRRDPYKNLTGLIEAFAKVRARGVDAVLRVIGSEDKRYPDAPRRALELGLNDHIEWAGYVSDQKLPLQYHEADVFVLASKYEGFGLPVLEAMASGTPVVCSNVSSLPEVAGDAALLVDPNSADAIADAIVRALSDPQLAASLREKGIVRAAQFSWRRTAELTLKAYEAAAGSTSS